MRDRSHAAPAGPLGAGESLLLALCAASAVLLCEVVALRLALPSYAGVLRHGTTALELWLGSAALLGACALLAWGGGRLLGASRAVALAACLIALGIPAALYALDLGRRVPALWQAGSPVGWPIALGLVAAGAALLLCVRRGGRARRGAALATGAAVLVLVYAALQHATGRTLPELLGPRTRPTPLGLAGIAVAASLPLGLLLAAASARRATGRLAAALAALLVALALAIWLDLPERGAAPASRPRAPSVLLIVADTLRADFVSCLGGPAGTTPHVDALARDAVVFERARSTAPWTTPAFGSLLSSTYPAEHRAGERTGHVLRRRGMKSSLETLAEVLAARGYRTAAVLTNSFLDRRYRLAQGFQRYQNQHAVEWYHPVSAWLGHARHRLLGGYRKAYLTAGQQTPRVLGMVDALERTGRPFLLLAHYMDAHRPYIAPRRFRDAAGSGARAVYGAEVRHLDHHVGRLLDALRERGLYDDLLVVFTSDHGEELDEGRLPGSRFDHGHSVFEELLHVPLIVKLPGGRLAGTRRAAPVSLIDVAPTILGALGIPPPAGFRGVDLLHGAPAGRVLFAETLLQVPEQKAALRGSDKLVLTELPPDRRHAAAYDLGSDPAERRPRPLAEAPPRFRPLFRALERHARASPEGAAPEPVELDPLRREQLEALGYGDAGS